MKIINVTAVAWLPVVFGCVCGVGKSLKQSSANPNDEPHLFFVEAPQIAVGLEPERPESPRQLWRWSPGLGQLQSVDVGSRLLSGDFPVLDMDAGGNVVVEVQGRYVLVGPTSEAIRLLNDGSGCFHYVGMRGAGIYWIGGSEQCRLSHSGNCGATAFPRSKPILGSLHRMEVSSGLTWRLSEQEIGRTLAVDSHGVWFESPVEEKVLRIDWEGVVHVVCRLPKGWNRLQVGAAPSPRRSKIALQNFDFNSESFSLYVWDIDNERVLVRNDAMCCRDTAKTAWIEEPTIWNAEDELIVPLGVPGGGNGGVFRFTPTGGVEQRSWDSSDIPVISSRTLGLGRNVHRSEHREQQGRLLDAREAVEALVKRVLGNSVRLSGAAAWSRDQRWLAVEAANEVGPLLLAVDIDSSVVYFVTRSSIERFDWVESE